MRVTRYAIGGRSYTRRVTADVLKASAFLVLGRALPDQDRTEESVQAFAAAEWTFERLGSRSQVVAAGAAPGDAYRRLGDVDAAANLCRRPQGRSRTSTSSNSKRG
jgi:hypothetical protein